MIHAAAYNPDSCLDNPNWVNCTGEWPDQYGCQATYTGAATTHEFYSNTDGEIENRYANNCRSNWARAVQWGSSGYSLIAQISTNDYHGPTSYTNTGYATYVWSQMIYAPSTTATACGGFQNGGLIYSTNCYSM